MAILSRSEIEILVNQTDRPLVSIFMPTQRVGAEMQQNPIRLKNLVGQAEAELIGYGLRAPQARSLLEPARALVDDGLFWQEQSDGLALLLSPDFFRAYRLPLNFEELVVVADHFHLKPLLPLLSEDGHFYVLALSQNEVRLWQATRYHISEVDLKNMPTSLAEALKYDDPEKQLQFHTASDSPRNPGDRQAIFHGHGVGSDDEKKNIWRFLQIIDHGLQAVLQHKSEPLLLACVDYLRPIFQEVNSYPHLLDQSITGNPKLLSPASLHKQAWSIVQPHFQQARRQATAQYQQLAKSGRASHDLREILPAAHYGRVDTLFVAVNRQQWGNFEPDTNTINLYGAAKPGADDLLDVAAMQTLLHGGTVYAVEPNQVPDNTPIAAIFRYSS